MKEITSFARTKTEDGRLMTFSNWHRSFPRPNVLSKCGFFFTQNGDEVQCCDCLVKIKHWTNKDHPLIEHYKSNKRCQFVQRYRNLIDNIGRKLADNCSAAERESTFSRHSLKQDIHSLTYAGFCMLNEKCKCASCGVEIENWYTCDIPLIEHYIKSPNCSYIQPFIIELKSTNNLLNNKIGVDKKTRNEPSREHLIHIQERKPTPSTNHVLGYKSSCDSINEKSFPAVTDHCTKTKQDFSSYRGSRLPVKDVLNSKNKEDFLLNLKKENTIYSESQCSSDVAVCKICLDNEVRITFQPCGHLVTCTVCSKHVDDCPICRRKIEGTFISILA